VSGTCGYFTFFIGTKFHGIELNGEGKAEYMRIEAKTLSFHIEAVRSQIGPEPIKSDLSQSQKLLHGELPPLLGGGLEPHFRVLFSAIFQVFPWGISIRVEMCGK